MDTVDGKVFHKKLPELLRKKLKNMTFHERQRLLRMLEDPAKKAGVLISENNIYYEAI